ncbi:hypothetical protein AA489_002312 [Salmonella enterica subsp. enterica]|nr:hypothetical protein [Salmonella enterica subsp. enterica]
MIIIYRRWHSSSIVAFSFPPKVLFLLQTAPEKSDVVFIYPMKPGHLSLRRYPLFNSCPIITSPR